MKRLATALIVAAAALAVTASTASAKFAPN